MGEMGLMGYGLNGVVGRQTSVVTIAICCVFSQQAVSGRH